MNENTCKKCNFGNSFFKKYVYLNSTKCEAIYLRSTDIHFFVYTPKPALNFESLTLLTIVPMYDIMIFWFLYHYIILFSIV